MGFFFDFSEIFCIVRPYFYLLKYSVCPSVPGSHHLQQGIFTSDHLGLHYIATSGRTTIRENISSVLKILIEPGLSKVPSTRYSIHTISSGSLLMRVSAMVDHTGRMCKVRDWNSISHGFMSSVRSEARTIVFVLPRGLMSCARNKKSSSSLRDMMDIAGIFRSRKLRIASKTERDILSVSRYPKPNFLYSMISSEGESNSIPMR